MVGSSTRILIMLSTFTIAIKRSVMALSVRSVCHQQIRNLFTKIRSCVCTSAMYEEGCVESCFLASRVV